MKNLNKIVFVSAIVALNLVSLRAQDTTVVAKIDNVTIISKNAKLVKELSYRVNSCKKACSEGTISKRTRDAIVWESMELILRDSKTVRVF